MSSQKPDSFSHRMEEASSLPAGDALRLEIERAVAGNGTPDAMRWNDLLTEAQTIREALEDVPVSPDLQRRLLTIPDSLPVNSIPARDAKRPVSWPAWVISAAVVIAAGMLLIQPRKSDSRLETVALLAVNNHHNHADEQNLSVETADPDELASVLSRELPFRITAPRLNAEFRLRGGRKCTLGAHPAALSLWKCGDAEYSAFQFRRNDFRISPLPQGRFVQLHEPAAGVSGTAWVWTRGNDGYVLVGSPQSPLNQLFPLTINRRPQ